MATAILGSDTIGTIDIAARNFELPAGEYQLRLLNSRFPEYKTRLVVTPNDTMRLAVSLWETVATLKLYVKPWAEVMIDDKNYGSTPLKEFLLEPGEHTIVLKHPSMATFTTTRTFVAGQRDTLTIELQPES